MGKGVSAMDKPHSNHYMAHMDKNAKNMTGGAVSQAGKSAMQEAVASLQAQDVPVYGMRDGTIVQILSDGSSVAVTADMLESAAVACQISDDVEIDQDVLADLQSELATVNS